ncbi:beta-galactosidase [Meiothermus taiwanensis]|uniref:beta-galactosidase n=1 Tax=Meiothermus taiwanensis TaxID=172827 RepID=UPI000E6521DA
MHAHAPCDQAVATDPVGKRPRDIIQGLDYFKWAQHEDLVSNDSYPNPADLHSYLASAMEFDLMRSLRRGERWILMEQAPSAVNWRALKRPGQIRRSCKEFCVRVCVKRGGTANHKEVPHGSGYLTDDAERSRHHHRHRGSANPAGSGP